MKHIYKISVDDVIAHKALRDLFAFSYSGLIELEIYHAISLKDPHICLRDRNGSLITESATYFTKPIGDLYAFRLREDIRKLNSYFNRAKSSIRIKEEQL